MNSIPWRGVISGALFGAALTAAGMYTPSTIIEQMNLTNFHMLKAFLAASGSSALTILLGYQLSLTKCSPRTPATISLPFGPYNGNVIGGIVLGLGLTLSGACPGTVWSQLVTGVPSAIPVLAGTVLGGILYSFLKPHITPSSSQIATAKNKPAFRKPTLTQRTGLSKANGVALYELLCITGILSANFFFPRNNPSLLSPIQGGLLVGLSQFTSLLLTTSTLGSSTAFEQIGDLFWWSFDTSKRRPSLRNTAFAVGTILGSFILTRYADVPISNGKIVIGTRRAVLGGVCLVVGSRIAGGCTSGHGISGMSMLSISSFVSVAAMFAAGIGSASFLRHRGI
ncbi:hypothetical protein HYALB_00004661 [Hymenoscyphus albidus]|uniref:Sulphur transport domain-containing protein n=1 Tax=Hymenoscyphus albidus TaxID=595503 RepID=A0A9N9LNZ6_9HELO|nr:hypothetical protein HYALB_00004661 [Hymenoscyphus albidus]